MANLRNRVQLRYGGWLLLSCVMLSGHVFAQSARPLPIQTCVGVDTRRLPDADVCRAHLLPNDEAGRSHRAFSALIALSDARRDAEKLGDAEEALACAAAHAVDGADPRQRYEIVRRYGLIDYKRDDIANALHRFDCALAIASELGDRQAIVKQLKNAGSARRRLGDYKTALAQSLRSLEMQEADGDPATGAVLNNIADIHRDSGRLDQAQMYYERALQSFRRTGDTVEAMHVYEMLAQLALDRADPATATRLLDTALGELRDAGKRKYRLRIYAGLARAAISQGDAERARRYCADGLALAAESGLSLPWELQLETARADRIGGRLAPALARLRAALAPAPEGDLAEAALRKELAIALRESGDDAGAMDALSAAHALELQDVRRQSDRQVLWLWDHFGAKERERENVTLRAQNRQRALMLWLTAVSALAALLLLSLFFLRRQQRARLEDAANRARFEEHIARYRRESAALAEDRDLLQTLLDSRDDAICLVDAEGAVLAANRAACRMLDAERQVLEAQPLSERFAGEGAVTLKTALERMEDAAAQSVSIAASADLPALRAELRQWEGGDGLIVVVFSAEATDVAETTPLASDTSAEPALTRLDSVLAASDTAEGTDAVPIDAASTPEHDEAPTRGAATMSRPAYLAGGVEAREEFRRALVALMLATVEVWERSTGTNRIELAERSRIWRVNIDDGRLRARAMERYLGVSKLPQNPRWRDVLRTAYFVLGQCTLDPAPREQLQTLVDAVLIYTRRSAMV